MAKNTILPGTGENYAADEARDLDDNLVKFQKVKIVQGSDGVVHDIDSSKPFSTKDEKLEELIVQMKIMNKYLQVLTNAYFDEDSVT